MTGVYRLLPTFTGDDRAGSKALPFSVSRPIVSDKKKLRLSPSNDGNGQTVANPALGHTICYAYSAVALT